MLYAKHPPESSRQELGPTSYKSYESQVAMSIQVPQYIYMGRGSPFSSVHICPSKLST